MVGLAAYFYIFYIIFAFVFVSFTRVTDCKSDQKYEQ